jgi:hypothetical protein
MFKFRSASAVVGLVFICACGSAPGGRPAAASSANPTTSPPNVNRTVLVSFEDDRQIGGQAKVIFTGMDGTMLATVPGQGVGDEHAMGAYLVTAADGSGAEWTVDPAGTVRPVAAAAAALLTVNKPGFPLIIDSTTAIIGCDPAPNLDCIADEVNMTTGAVGALLTAPSTGAATMQLGPALTVLDVSSDLRTVWFREVAQQGSSGKLDIAAVDLRTDTVTRYPLPAALLYEQDLAISRDGKWVAGHEGAGLDSNKVATAHLHLVSLATGTDIDIQGSAPYVAGGHTPSIQFSPGGATLAWWGSLNSGGTGMRVNVASLGGVGTTLVNQAEPLENVLWLDSNRLVVQDDHGAIFTIDAGTREVAGVNGTVQYLLAVLHA